MKLQFLKVRVAIQISETFYERPPYTVIYDGLWHFARVRLRNRFILRMPILLLAYYFILDFQIVGFPYFWSLSLSILTSPADPPTLRNRIRLSIRLRILLLAPRMFWTHGSAAASAKRTEIRRAVRSFRVARHGVSNQGHYSRKLKQLLVKTSRSRRL